MAPTNKSPHQVQGRGTLEGILRDRVECLAELLREIERSIKERHELSKSILESIEEQALDARNKLLELEHFPVGSSNWADQRRMVLEQILAESARDRRNEMVLSWQDTTRFGQEARDRLQEYRDLLQRTRLLMAEP